MKFMILISLVSLLLSGLAGASQPDAGGALSTAQISSLLMVSTAQNPSDPFSAAIQSDGLAKTLTDDSVVQWHMRPFPVELKNIGGITDQADSGDCWIYATLNVFKSFAISANLAPADFEFSKSYVYFYSNVEKVNIYFENLIAARLKSISSRAFRRDFRLADDDPEYLISDGGEFAWMRFLVSKYGLVPEQAMPTTKVALNDSLMLSMLRTEVLMTAKKLTARMSTMGPSFLPLTANQKAELRQIKLEGLTHVLSTLRLTLGNPPDDSHPFQFAVKGETKTFTPKSFVQDLLQLNTQDYASISSTPLRPFGKTYMIAKHSSIGVLGQNDPTSFDLRYVNEQSSRLAELIKASIDAGQAVYFGVDVSDDVSDSGVMDTHLYKTDAYLYPSNTNLTLAEQMRDGLIYSNHAMAIVGYEADATGNLIRFKVENSWGDSMGMKGYYSMSRDWFDKYAQEIAVHKTLLNPKELNLWQNAQAVPVTNYDDFFGTE